MSRLTVAVELSLWLAGGALKRQIALSIRAGAIRLADDEKRRAEREGERESWQH